MALFFFLFIALMIGKDFQRWECVKILEEAVIGP